MNPDLTKIKIGSSTYNLFIATASNQTTVGSSGADVLYGLSGGDVLNGLEGDDVFIGGNGADQIHGKGGNDIFYGGLGDDFFLSADGDDTFIYERGWGFDTFGSINPSVTNSSDDIASAQDLGVHAGGLVDQWKGGYYWQTSSNSLLKLNDAGTDTIVFGKAISASDLNFSWSGEGIEITFNGTPSGDKVRLTQQAVANARIEKVGVDGKESRYFVVADAGSGIASGGSGNDLVFGLNSDDLLYGYDMNDEMYGGGGSDTLYGGWGADVLVGGIGNDIIRGEWDDDRYVFRKGDGSDVFDDSSGTADVAAFEKGIRPDELNLAWSGQNLIITVGQAANGDKVTLKNQSSSSDNKIEKISFNKYGAYNLVAAPSTGSSIAGTSDRDALFGLSGNEQLDGSLGDNLFVGGAGNDLLIGGAGNDRYVFSAGSGADTVRDDSGDQDEIIFGEGIDAEDLWLQKSGNDLVISVLGTNDKVTVEDWYSSSNPKPIERIVAGNGEVLKSANVSALVSAMAAFQPASGSSPTGVHANDLDVNNPAPVGTVAVAIAQNWMAA